LGSKVARLLHGHDPEAAKHYAPTAALEQMMGERGVSVDYSIIYRWVHKYAPEIEKRLRWQWRGPISTSWRFDETYVKIRGQ